MMKKPISLLVLCVLMVSGCDAERLKQYSLLASVGSAYAAAFPAFSTAVGSSFITINNDLAIREHPLAASDPERAKTKILQQDADIKTYLATLNRLNAQVKILGAYFDALGRLAGTKSSDQTVTSANGLVEQISSLNTTLGATKLPNSKTLDELAGPFAKIVVAHFQVKALDENLDRHAQVIDRALALQNAVVEVMSKQLALDLKGDDQIRETILVVDPYKQKELSKTWAADRAAYVQSSVSIESADAAQQAITKLRSTFHYVVTNKDHEVDFNGVLDAIGAMAGYAVNVKSAVESTK